MNQTSAVVRAIGYAFGASVATSFIVLFVGMCAFGSELTAWAEGQGRVVGVIGTTGAVAGAAIGLLSALRAQRRAVQ